MAVVLVRAADQRVVPWRNGGGTTTEVAVGPGEPFAWRASRARVAADGPFSDFSGYARVLVLLRGAGMELTFRERVIELAREGQSVRFDGGEPCSARLLAGETEDFNWMVRRDAGEPEVTVLRAPTAAEGVLVYALGTALAAIDGMEFALEEGDALVGERSMRVEWRRGLGLVAGVARPSRGVGVDEAIAERVQ